MKVKTLFAGGLVLSIISIALAQESRHNYMPPEGYVPNADTAIKIAVAVWLPIYGAKKIESEKPFKSHLKNDVWTVVGSLPSGWHGGVAIAEISKKDGRILRVSHGK